MFSVDVLIVLGIVVAALVLFATEPIPMDITALGILVVLVLLEPWTGVSPEEGISGFASPATITVLAMFILSEGIRKSGAVQVLGTQLGKLAGGSLSKQLGSIVGIVVPSSGFLNNTGIVAILLPMVSDMANETNISPSKLLIPLSYASMFGGMLTVIGTSTNLLASDLAYHSEAIGRHIGMFEFAPVGVIISLVGALYLITVCPYLLTDRIEGKSDLTERFNVRDYLTEVQVQPGSPLIGRTVRGALADVEFVVQILQLLREGDTYLNPSGQQVIRGYDILIVKTDQANLMKLIQEEGLSLLQEIEVDETELDDASRQEHNLVEIVIAPRSNLVGETIEGSNFRNKYQGTVLAVRHGGQLVRDRLDNMTLRVGDTLLVQAPPQAIARLDDNRNFIVAQELEKPDYRRSKIPVSLGIAGGVIGLATAGLTSILTAALLGALGMVLTGCLKPTEMYDAVDWDIVFLLAGIIPLGIALNESGADRLLAELFVETAYVFSPLIILGLVYLVTALLTNIISNNASVLLMIPVAIDTAQQLGVNEFTFLLSVTFAASTAFMTPMCYQTNLFVYGPGGYRFTDYLWAGAPLQLIFTVVTPLSLAYFWPL